MEYTDRVTLGENGMYHWYYDLDMRKNRYMLNVTLKVLGIIGAALLAMVLLMPSGPMSKWAVAGIIFGCFAFVVLLTLGIYALMYARRGGFYRYRYDMGPDGVWLLQEEADANHIRALGVATAVAGAASGRPVRGLASSVTLQSAANAGYTAFSSVRKAVVEREKDCIRLRPLVGENCVFVKQEDFDFVREYILGRLKNSAVVEGDRR